MKTNALLRIVLFSVLAVGLCAVLIAGIWVCSYGAASSDTLSQSEAAFGTELGVKNVSIDWAAGSVTIRQADVDSIVVSESGYFSKDLHSMSAKLAGDTIKIDYTTKIRLWGVSLPSKDLVITVPMGWSFEELDIDGASLEVAITDVAIRQIDLDGASIDFQYSGVLKELECDGASCSLHIRSTEKPERISIDGASCSLKLTVPQDCGFLVMTEGLSCDVSSTPACEKTGSDYLYGDGYTKINVSGVSCEVTVDHID